MKLDPIIDYLSFGDNDSEWIAEECARKYGIGADEVLDEKQRRIDVLDNLKVILDFLTDTQREVLLFTGAGYTLTEIADELQITVPSVKEAKAGISKKLQKESDEERIQKVAAEVVRLAKTSRGRHSQLYGELCDELDRRFALREALKKLFVLLTPPQSKKEMDGKTSMPAYTFERVMQIGEGMREGIQDGKKVMKTIVRCRMPEYMIDTFGDRFTCCTLCATCTRKKDVSGRAGYDKYGLEKLYV